MILIIIIESPSSSIALRNQKLMSIPQPCHVRPTYPANQALKLLLSVISRHAHQHFSQQELCGLMACQNLAFDADTVTPLINDLVSQHWLQVTTNTCGNVFYSLGDSAARFASDCRARSVHNSLAENDTGTALRKFVISSGLFMDTPCQESA